MGKVMEKKKKKKGRPSLLDLQKRSLKQQQEQQQQQQQLKKPQLRPTQNSKSPNPTPSHSSLRRSTRRNPNPSPNPNSSDDDDPRRKKKLKLVSNLSDDEDDADAGSGDEDDGPSRSSLRKRKIESIAPGSGVDGDDKGEKHSAATNQTSPQQGSKVDDGPSTPLPDKKLLLFILDRLQKKDTYGVFAEPVDPEELPDYHEVIAHPMDFSTIRKKLTSGAYASLEQFEKDVFLLCSNAMQYNAPDTIYFRQARSIQELAKKNFDNLRQDSDDNNEAEREPEPEPKVARRGRPPTKNLKRTPGRPPSEHTKPPMERAKSGPSQGTLPSSAGNNTNRPNNDVRKVPFFLDKYGTADLLARSGYGLRFGETYINWSAERQERADDMTASTSKGIMMKHGKKNIVLDDNRRNTYHQSISSTSRGESSVLTTFDRERKNLIPVGLHTEYGYARSLARFAAKLGPVAWKFASRKIQRCLHPNVKFGPSWVGENEAPSERPVPPQLPSAASGQPSQPASLPVSGDSSAAHDQDNSEPNHSEQNPEEQSSKTHIPPIEPKLDEGSSKAPSPSVGKDGFPVSSSPVITSNGNASKLNASEASTSSNQNTTSSMLNITTGAVKAGQPSNIHCSPSNQPRINGFNFSNGLNFAAQMGKMIAAAKPMIASRTETQSLDPSTADSNGCEGTRKAENSSTKEPSDGLSNTGLPQKAGSAPPDLNVGFQSPGSPFSGKTDSVQPDLALQL